MQDYPLYKTFPAGEMHIIKEKQGRFGACIYETSRWICLVLGSGWYYSGPDSAEYICGSFMHYSLYISRIYFILLLIVRKCEIVLAILRGFCYITIVASSEYGLIMSVRRCSHG